uniref:Ubiquitin specific peptidase 54b n=1 Tax=Sinocyclocheilus grahami TaxID=75366 RepID=A0A672KKT1_SINGR
MSWKRNYFASGSSGLQGMFTPRTMTSIAPSKGLSNEPGQNSCFLNSALQVLWHLDIFRRSFRQLNTHKCMEDSCIFCALKSIFAQFQFSSEKVLPSDALRSALAKTFQDEQRFQLGIMDDAAECFVRLLFYPHFTPFFHTFSSCVYFLSVVLTLVLEDTSVSYSLCCSNQAVRMLECKEKPTPDMFGELLRNASTMGDLRNCPSNCGEMLRIRRVLMNCPEIISIGLVWDSDHSDLAEDVIHSLGTCLRLGDVRLLHARTTHYHCSFLSPLQRNNLELPAPSLLCTVQDKRRKHSVLFVTFNISVAPLLQHSHINFMAGLCAILC